MTFDAGLAVYRQAGVTPTPEERLLLKAIAAILSGAGGSEEDEVQGRKVFQFLKQEAPLCRNWMATVESFATVGHWWRENGLTQADLIGFVRWLRDGGLNWMDATPRWSMFVKYGPEWVADSRTEPDTPSALAELREETDL